VCERDAWIYDQALQRSTLLIATVSCQTQETPGEKEDVWGDLHGTVWHALDSRECEIASSRIGRYQESIELHVMTVARR
jgi:hypothetical protein